MSSTQPTASKPSRLISIKFILKLAFVVALLYFLVRKGFISIEATQRAFTHWDKLLIAFGVNILTLLICLVRWQKLLLAQNIQLKWKRIFQLAFIGNFFNIALPGAVSGDFVKAIYVAKEVHAQRSRAFGSIVFDRVAGLSALVLLSASSLILGFSSMHGTRLFHTIQVSVGFAALVVISFYGYLFLVREHHDPLLKLLRSLQNRYPLTGSITRIYESVRHYHNHRFIVIQVLLLSVVIHILVSYSCLNFAKALGEENISLSALFAVVPIGLLVTAIPILPAGVGTGHAAFLALFHLIGSQRGADVFSLFALVQICFGAVGGLVYLRFRSHEPSLVLSSPKGAEFEA